MSKVKIKGNASGSGTLTIVAPNTDTDRTITLPDEDVTLGGGSSGGSSGGGDYVKIASQSFNGSVASLTFTDCFSDTYDYYKVFLTDFRATTSNWPEIYGLLSSDSGSSYHSSYSYVDTTQTKLRLSAGYDMGQSKIIHADFIVAGARDTNAYTTFNGLVNRNDSAGVLSYSRDRGCGLKSKVAVDTFQIYPSSATLDAGTVAIYGIKA